MKTPDELAERVDRIAGHLKETSRSLEMLCRWVESRVLAKTTFNGHANQVRIALSELSYEIANLETDINDVR